MTDTPMITYYMGKRLDELTREELIEAVEQLGRSLQSAHAGFTQFADFHRKTVDYYRTR